MLSKQASRAGRFACMSEKRAILMLIAFIVEEIRIDTYQLRSAIFTLPIPYTYPL
jgi:hypothetical protein